MMVAMMAGDQNRKRDQDERGNQASSPPFVFLLRRVFEAFDAPLEPPYRVVVVILRTGGTG
jgi:hypothetical protein